MATFAVGDIHGNLDALRDLLDRLALEARRGDRIVFLGDYVDRGRDSKGCIDAILGFEQSVDAEVVCRSGITRTGFFERCATTAIAPGCWV